MFEASVWGISVPWTLAVAALLGIGLMAVPGTLDVAKPAASIFNLGGALIVVTSVVCMGEVLRAGRYFNVLLGLVVAAGPWVLGGAGLAAQLVGVAAGLLAATLAFPRGPIKERYGTWDWYVF